MTTAIQRKRLWLVNSSSYTPPKDIAKWVREDLKAAMAAGELGKDLPEDLTFSVTSRASAIEVTIKGVTPEWLWTFGYVDVYRSETWHHSTRAVELQRAAEAIRNRYNETITDASDVGADYTSRRYYGSVSYDWRIREPQA